MKIEIEISEEKIADLVEHEIAHLIVEEHRYENHEAKMGIRSSMDKAVQQYLYQQKDTIIERVVERAAAEMVRKGIPKLLAKVGEDR